MVPILPGFKYRCSHQFPDLVESFPPTSTLLFQNLFEDLTHLEILFGEFMAYVDGYVLPMPTRNLSIYRRIAQKAGKIWREHGALEYRESAGDDLDVKWGIPFSKMMKLKPGETVIFAWVVFESKAHRDRVNAKVMKDPRLAKMIDPSNMPFDSKRMVYGGF
jgi:uncharacterized protein YbaA (DUF1428 family)